MLCFPNPTAIFRASFLTLSTSHFTISLFVEARSVSVAAFSGNSHTLISRPFARSLGLVAGCSAMFTTTVPGYGTLSTSIAPVVTDDSTFEVSLGLDWLSSLLGPPYQPFRQLNLHQASPGYFDRARFLTTALANTPALAYPHPSHVFSTASRPLHNQNPNDVNDVSWSLDVPRTAFVSSLYREFVGFDPIVDLLLSADPSVNVFNLKSAMQF
ncbi:hypothetical protein B0H13DRAFT_2299988 [Mycena leptocephala]|nr:hypothetical protein B0H13DRAFT_2299988 [Mycena leptocephala]